MWTIYHENAVDTDGAGLVGEAEERDQVYLGARGGPTHLLLVFLKAASDVVGEQATSHSSCLKLGDVFPFF